MSPDTAVPAVVLPWLAPALLQALRGLRGHAVLVQGPRGVGQFELSLALASAWLCESPPAGRPDDGRACGHCAACRLIASRTHPDLMVVVPPALREALGWAGDEDAADAGDGSKSKAKPSKDIKVEAIRLIVDFAQQTAARGQGKVVVVFPAERMNATSANTLLKTLEEPPGATRFIVATSAPQRLLPTVRSRCQVLPVPVPDAVLATHWLEEQGLKQADVLLAAAGGAPLEALERAQAGIDAATWQALPRAVLAGDATPMAGWPIATVIDALQKLCHDLTAAAVGAPARFFRQVDLPRAVNVEPLTACARQLAESSRHAEHPWNATLALEALVARVTQAADRALVRESAGTAARVAKAPLAKLSR